MPYTKTKLPNGTYRVTSPHGVRAKSTTKKKADAQIRVLNAIERDPTWRPHLGGRRGR